MRICYETAPSGGHSWQLAESRPMHKHGIITYIHNTLHVRFLCIISSVCVLMSCEDSHVWTLHQLPARTPLHAARWPLPKWDTNCSLARFTGNTCAAMTASRRQRLHTVNANWCKCTWHGLQTSHSDPLQQERRTVLEVEPERAVRVFPLPAPARVCARPPRYWSSDYLRAKWESGVSIWGSDMIT